MDGTEHLIIERKLRPTEVVPGGNGESAVGTLDHAGADTPGGLGSFEKMYRDAGGDPSLIPWADRKPNPALVSWLNAEAARRVRPGSRAVVIGCGLGDDVIELINRGYDATGFDIAPTAIEWARARFPNHADAFFSADLLRMPSRYRHRFELVVESYTLQSLHPVYREPSAQAISSLCGPRGHVLAIARGRDEGELLETIGAPPWPLTRTELLGLMESVGLKPARPIDDFLDDQTPAQRRLRGLFERA